MPTRSETRRPRRERRRRAVDSVRDRLVRRGFPTRGGVRYARELQAHWEDLRDERLEAGARPADAEAEADARLGTPDELVAAAVRVHRAGSFAGRHPLLCFLLVPFLAVPLLPVLIAAAVTLAFSEPWSDEMEQREIAAGNAPRPAVEGMLAAYWSFKASTYAVPAAVAVIGYRAARRRTLSARWAWAACAAAALSGGLQRVNLSVQRGDRPTALMLQLAAWPDPAVVCFVVVLTALAAWLVRPRRWRFRDTDPAGPSDAALAA